MYTYKICISYIYIYIYTIIYIYIYIYIYIIPTLSKRETDSGCDGRDNRANNVLHYTILCYIMTSYSNIILYVILFVYSIKHYLAQDKGGPSKCGFPNDRLFSTIIDYVYTHHSFHYTNIQPDMNNNQLFRKPPLLGPPLSLPD